MLMLFHLLREKRAVLTAHSEMKTSGATKGWAKAAGLAVRLQLQTSSLFHGIAARIRSEEAAELLEFALAVPLILVMVIGILDFSHAYNMKQKLANAAREGARLGGSELYTDINSSNPPSVVAIKDDVTTYLRNAGIDTSFISSAMTYNTTTYTATCYSTGTYGLKIERYVNVPYTDPTTGNTTAMPSTRVTLRYPYDWTYGFNHVIKMLMPSSSFTNPITIETDATMVNQ